MLLRFRVANHRSIRDEQTLSLTAASRRGEAKRATPLEVAGIYGANASGKSNVLDSLRWMSDAIRLSHTHWKPTGGVPRRPFKLSPAGRQTPSFYEIDFLHEGVRYSYGFEADDEMVLGEWLNTFPRGRTRRLFDRSGPADFTFGRGLTGETQRIRKLTRPNSLYLSCAASNNHPLLSGLYESLTSSGAYFIQHGEIHEKFRLDVVKHILDAEYVTDDINELLRIADLGVERMELVETGPQEKKVVLRRRIDAPPLSLEEESAGTRAWLSLLGHTLSILYIGGTLLADEIDSSLHPLLSSTLIRMFKDPDINRHGAQLIFSSHDTTLLGSLLEEEVLARDEVWFTEKDDSGATSLYSLAEFHTRRDENIERGYLQGRYGAAPYLNFENIREIFMKGPVLKP
ncbi:ATP-binding protein [Nonomuraea sp. PA05]|uniref:AAA family ATPase n=1 Tax=Nonomuraea sp. PA05 TaxID=2604466 RepID=UPI0011D910DD|nr:ATP-binding protein [Nonomuraea sp. PA05]TYB57810.1 ATP-binding protein [Nonomuraea sp. PA05]